MQSTVEYYLLPDEENEEHHETDAKPLYSYPDSTEYNKQFPEANKYYSKDSNWQSALYSGLTKDRLYKIKAKASKEIDGMLVCSFGIVASCNGEFPIQLIHRHIGLINVEVTGI